MCPRVNCRCKCAAERVVDPERVVDQGKNMIASNWALAKEVETANPFDFLNAPSLMWSPGSKERERKRDWKEKESRESKGE